MVPIARVLVEGECPRRVARLRHPFTSQAPADVVLRQHDEIGTFERLGRLRLNHRSFGRVYTGSAPLPACRRR